MADDSDPDRTGDDSVSDDASVVDAAASPRGAPRRLLRSRPVQVVLASTALATR